MKLKAEIGGETHDVELTREGDRFTARLGESNYDLEISEPEPGVLLLKNEGRIYEAAVSRADKTAFNVRLRNAEFEINVTDPKRLRGSGAGDAHSSGKAEIKTAMPGKVVRILASEGQAVQKGDGVIVVEAMKMQNEMKAARDGTVSQIKVAEGDTVGAGDVLVVIE